MLMSHQGAYWIIPFCRAHIPIIFCWFPPRNIFFGNLICLRICENGRKALAWKIWWQRGLSDNLLLLCLLRSYQGRKACEGRRRWFFKVSYFEKYILRNTFWRIHFEKYILRNTFWEIHVRGEGGDFSKCPILSHLLKCCWYFFWLNCCYSKLVTRQSTWNPATL